jgi:hypothetical protein
MDSNNKLFRQVHPSFVQGDSVSSQVFSSQTFRPTPKDDNKLSVYNETVFTAKESFDHFQTQGYVSAGVVGVSKEECDTENLLVTEDNIPFEGHCSIDYNGLEQNAIKKKAKKLKNYATKRGWIFVGSNDDVY